MALQSFSRFAAAIWSSNSVRGMRSILGTLVLFDLTLQAAEPDRWEQSIRLAGRLHNERRLPEARTVLLGTLSEASSHPDREYRLAYTLDNLGSVAQDQGKYFEAESYYRRSIAHWQAAGERWRDGLARTLNNLSSLLYGAGKFREAEELLRRSGAESTRGTDTNSLVLLNSGTLYLKQRKYRQAEEMYRLAWGILQPQRDSHPEEFARLSHHLGLICEATGRKEEAKTHFATAQQIWEQQVKRDTPTTEAIASLAALYSMLGQVTAARELLQRGLVVAEREFEPSHPQVADLLSLYAQVLRQNKQKAEAVACEKRAETIRMGSQERLARHAITVSALTQEKRNK